MDYKLNNVILKNSEVALKLSMLSHQKKELKLFVLLF
jgi:hypothetical protein